MENNEVTEVVKTEENKEEKVEIPFSHQLVISLQRNVPKFKDLVENYPGSCSQLKRILIADAESGLTDENPTFSYPHEKELYELKYQINNAKYALYRIEMNKQQTVSTVTTEETQTVVSNDTTNNKMKEENGNN